MVETLIERAKKGLLTDNDREILADLDNDYEFRRVYALQAIAKHKENRFEITIQDRDLRNRRGNFAKAKAILNANSSSDKIEIDCIVACNNWEKLNEFKQNQINILDHLDKFFQNKYQRGIGICTFQNGIQNTFSELEGMGDLIFEKFGWKRPPFLIGFHNKTTGFIYGLKGDLERLINEWHLNINSVLTFRQLVYTFSDCLHEKVLWSHICHSEAGLIANEVLTNKENCLGRDQIEFAEKQLIIASYGAVAPVPNLVLEAINTYSLDDITMNLARKYLDKTPKPSSNNDENLKVIAKGIHQHPLTPKHKTEESIYEEIKAGSDKFFIGKYPHKSKKNCKENEYELTVVESLGGYGFALAGDHAFDGKTYQQALFNNIDYLKGTYTIL